jgi:tripartite-type tricarboxylate transporter receptor subunit TctC
MLQVGGGIHARRIDDQHAVLPPMSRQLRQGEAGGRCGGTPVRDASRQACEAHPQGGCHALILGFGTSKRTVRKPAFMLVELMVTIAIVVPETSPHKTLAELVSFGRANPGKLNIGTINIGSTQHLAGELFRTQANLIAQIIPYNGTPAVINALRGGQVDVVVEILGPLKPQINAKAVRLLGVMGAKRPKDLPQTPVVSELPGLSSFNVSSWNALAAPGKTPPAVVSRLNAELVKVLAMPDMVQRLAGFNVQAQSSTPTQLAQLLDADIKRWTEVIQKAGIPQQ